MSERLRHPGFIRRILFGERPPQETLTELQEFKAIRQALHLRQPLNIFYPACGTDISVSRVFSRSNIFYIDTDPKVCEVLRSAKLPRKRTTITEGSALDSDKKPQDVDLVILRNASIEGTNFDKTVASLIDPLKKGGYVITNAWGNSSTASELQERDDMRLVGYLARTQRNGKMEFIQSNLEQVSKNLIAEKDSLFGAYPGKTFVFQKKK